MAGITIKFATDDNGIIKQSQNAKTQYEKASTQEQLAINDMETAIQKASNGTSGSSGTSGGSSGSTGSSGSGGNNSEEVDNLKGKLTCYMNAGIQLAKPGGAINRQSSTNMKVHVYFISNEIQ